MIGNVPTLTLTVSILSATVVCFKRFQLEIPNGDKVPNPCNKNELWTAVGHTNIEGGGRRNPFGQVFQNQKTWGGMLCDSDSDGDGITNGAELGDPDCDWVKGRTPKRTENITHPGICEPMDSERCKEKNSWLRCPEDPNAFCPELSKPDVKSLDLKLDKTRVPATSTTWMCQILPWPEEGDFHVIGSKPLVDNADVTHHMIVFGCGSTVSQRPGPYQCNMVPDRECQDILLTWTMGSKGECLHKEEGFRMGSKGYTHVALQVHWNNIHQRSTYVDGSGIQVFYTNKLRKYDSVIMVVGQKYLELPPNAPEVIVNSSCPAFCTENMFQKPIFITRAVNHMHTLGKKQQVALYRDGGFVRNITNDEVYDYNSPFFYRFDKPIEVRPGDEIRTTCTYSTVGINRTIFYGVSIKDEMCYSFLTYFPHQRSYTQFCTTFKDTQVCKRYLPRLQGVYDDCSWRAFINGKDMTAVEMTKRVETECEKTESCSASCSDALDVMSKHPCMHGEIHGYVSEKWPMMKQTPISNRQEKFLCCFCCKSGPITAILRLDRIGFVLGESIPFQAEIQNMSKRACTVQMKLIMNISYHVKGVTKILPTLAAQVLYPGNITPGETEIWSGGQLLIPSDLPPSHLPGCQIMNINYSLQLVVLPAGPATQLKVPIDILIGSIPIRFNQQQQVGQLPLSPPPYQDPSPTQPAPTSTSGANLLLTQLAQLSYIEALRNEEGEVTQ